MITRRRALQTLFLTTAAVAGGSRTAVGAAQVPAGGKFELPALPYAFDALEPHIDARTMEIHHGKHHAGYVANLNKALANHPDLAGQPIEQLIRGLNQLPDAVRTAVRNNGGGHYNHSLFWPMMSKAGGGEPKGELAKAIQAKFGSFEGFQQAFTAAALSRFGSGWAWLTMDESGGIHVESTANQDNPLTDGRRPLLGIDVWEHAYYLKYQNRRGDYVAAFFNVIHWDTVAAHYREATA